jgi:hypothetical protein
VFSTDGKRILIKSSVHHSIVWEWQKEPTKTIDGASSNDAKDTQVELDDLERTFPAFSTPGASASVKEGVATVRDESGRRLPIGVLDFGPYDHDPVAALSSDRRYLALAAFEGVVVMQAFSDSAELLNTAKAEMPRCLSPRERKHFNMESVPPRWCITGVGREAETDPARWIGVWPYDTAEYREWLTAADAARAKAASRLGSFKARIFREMEPSSVPFPSNDDDR